MSSTEFLATVTPRAVPRRGRLLALALCALVSAAARAADAAPNGPIEILADHATAEGDVQVLSGNVRIRSRTLSLDGSDVALEQRADGQLHAVVTGTPARVEHAATTLDTGREVPAMQAEATRIVYDSAAGTIRLEGDVRLMRAGDTLTGGEMVYGLASRTIRAERSGGEPVRLIIQAPEDLARELQQDGDDAEPSL